MNSELAETTLVSLLQKAYSGELAAALAYRGHSDSVRNSEERIRIRQIEEEEWTHRKMVGNFLCRFNSRPNRLREFKAYVLGNLLGFACHFLGWFAPMYLAGYLESKNIVEYRILANLAQKCGQEGLLEPLLFMSEIEREHEEFFRSKVLSHPWKHWIPLWPSPNRFNIAISQKTLP